MREIERDGTDNASRQNQAADYEQSGFSQDEGAAASDVYNEALSAEQENIREWFAKVKFRKSLFGGVNERQLWKKLSELNELYDRAISAERARYDALLEDNNNRAKKVIAKYKSAYEQKNAEYNSLVSRIRRAKARAKSAEDEQNE